MKFIAVLVMIIVFFYTAGFAVSLWKDNKVGAFAIFILAIGIVIAPFFSVLD